VATPELVDDQFEQREPDNSGTVDALELAGRGVGKLRLVSADTDATEAPATISQPSEQSRQLQPEDFRAAGREWTEEQTRLYSQCYHMPEAIARKLAFDWGVRGTELEEFISDGYEGLVKAVRDFDRDKLHKLATTGTSYITGKIVWEIKRRSRDRNLWRYYEDGKELHVPRPWVTNGTAASFEEFLSSTDGDETVLMHKDTLEAREQEFEGPLLARLEADDLAPRILAIVETYSERDREVFDRYTRLGQTQPEIAAELGTYQQKIGRSLERMSKDISKKLRLAKPK
jgi:RNA polymerase sigma factor (sigma-70 family)